MADVFISYAREDRPVAEQLAHALGLPGRTVWWDREILPGKDFAELIAAELATAKAVVVIWSPSSVKSGWVRDEAHEGLERSVLVPVMVGVSEPPIGYRSIHAVDLTDWQGGEHPGLADVRLAIETLCTGVPVPDRAEPSRNSSPTGREPGQGACVGSGPGCWRSGSAWLRSQPCRPWSNGGTTGPGRKCRGRAGTRR